MFIAIIRALKRPKALIKSLIYNSVSIFILIDNIEYITFNNIPLDNKKAVLSDVFREFLELNKSKTNLITIVKKLENNIVKNILLEDSRNSLLQQSKRGKKERDGKTRYEKRLNVKMANSVNSYNNIDMDKLFKEDIINLHIPITGETAGYFVKISFGDFLERLRK